MLRAHLPCLPLDPLARHSLAIRPAFADRLAPAGDAVLAVDPLDLPGVLLIARHAGQLRLRLAPAKPVGGADAVLRAPLRLLIGLAEGGSMAMPPSSDASCKVEERSDIGVACRNALEEAEIVFARDLPAAFGPLAPLARPLQGRRDAHRRVRRPFAGAGA